MSLVGQTVQHWIKSDTAPLRASDCPQGEVVSMTTDGQLIVRQADGHLNLWKADACRVIAPAPKKKELLVLSGKGIRTGVIGHYGLFDETPNLEAAITIAREKLATGHACAFIAIRIEADLIDGIGDGIERELARFEVYPDRVVLVPADQGGLSDEQKAKVFKLSKQRWHGRSLL